MNYEALASKCVRLELRVIKILFLDYFTGYKAK